MTASHPNALARLRRVSAVSSRWGVLKNVFFNLRRGMRAVTLLIAATHVPWLRSGVEAGCDGGCPNGRNGASCQGGRRMTTSENDHLRMVDDPDSGWACTSSDSAGLRPRTAAAAKIQASVLAANRQCASTHWFSANAAHHFGTATHMTRCSGARERGAAAARRSLVRGPRRHHAALRQGPWCAAAAVSVE